MVETTSSSSVEFGQVPNCRSRVGRLGDLRSGDVCITCCLLGVAAAVSPERNQVLSPDIRQKIQVTVENIPVTFPIA